jgi:dihydrofolate reductase/thymidylate synthase
MAHFQKVTTQAPVGKVNAVVMGRKTWESIPPRFRPLPGRTNLILTSHNSAITTNNAAFPDHVLVASSLPEAWSQLEQHVPNLHQVFVIGGAQVYQACLEAGYITRVIYTQVSNLPDHTPMDTFFPDLPASDWECQPFVQDAHDDGVVSKDDMVHHNNDKENQHNAPVTTPTTTTKLENSGKLQSPLLHTDPSSGLQYQFLEYTKIPQGPDVNPEEMQYLQLCRDILDTGVVRGDRTGTGTRSKFGVHMRFNLRNGVLPLLTTKRTFWRGVAEELLWFISVRMCDVCVCVCVNCGSDRACVFLFSNHTFAVFYLFDILSQGNTNANVLAAKDIHIWDGNGSREFLDHRGLSHREEGDLGPVYGFQWRHFGATYVDMHTDYTGQGVDQLADCIDKIIHTPEDRRIIMSAWNPADLHLMALPPCHMFCQFYVSTMKERTRLSLYLPLVLLSHYSLGSFVTFQRTRY